MATRELPVSVALAALSAAAALAFGAVFASDAYVGPLIGAAVLPHALGWVARRWAPTRGWGAVISAGGLLVYAVALVGPDQLVDRLQAGWTVVRTDTVPIRATEGAVLLAVIAVWVMASVADEVAFRYGASMGALAPAMMLVIWVRALGTRSGWVPSTVAFGVAAVAFLALQHQALLERRRTRVGRATGNVAPRLFAAAVGAGLLATLVGAAVAPALPGGDHALVGIGNFGSSSGDTSYRTSIAPLVNIGDQLRQGTRQSLFTVRAAQPDYWRITALDEYSSVGGGQWTLTARGNGSVGQGLATTAGRGALHQTYRIGPLTERWMPAAYDPVAVTRSDTLVVRASGTLVTGQSSVSGLQYSVDSRLPVEAPTATAAQRTATAAPIPAALRSDTALPSDVPPIVIATAKSVTAGRTNRYDQAAALRDYFRGGQFTYDPNVALGDDEGAMSRFLVERHGFCVQFAGTFAVMARALGIPTRVAVGFTPGAADATGTYTVTNYEAHAWPEVWLAGFGWTHLFDPTPRSPQPGGSALPGEPPGVGTPNTRTAPVPTTAVPTPAPGNPNPTPSPAPGPAPAPNRGATVVRGRTNTGTSTLTWVLLIAALVVAAGITIVGTVVARKARRRARRRAAPDPAEQIAGAWAEVLDAFQEAGIAWPASLTPLEVATGLPRRVGDDLEPPLASLAGRYTAARYGAQVPGPGVVDGAWKDADDVRRALDASLDLRSRLRARLRVSGLRRQPEPAGWSEPRSR